MTTDGEGAEGPKPEKPKARKKRKAKGKKPARARNSKATQSPADSRARARDPDKRPSELPSIDEIQRQVRIEQLLERLAEKGEEITVAARALKIDRKTLWRWRKDDPGLDLELAEAYRVGTESLVAVAHSRATEGWEEPVYQGGTKVGSKRVYDHNLLAMLIRKRDPSFRDPKYALPVTPPKGAGEISLDLDKMPPALLAQLEAEARRQHEERAKAPALAR